MKFSRVFLFIFLSVAVSFSQDCNIEEINNVSKVYKLNANTLLSIAKHESECWPYSIGVISKDRLLVKSFLDSHKKEIDFRYKNSNTLFSIYIADYKNAALFHKLFLEFNANNGNAISSYDLGIMQINSTNFVSYGIKENEVDYFLDNEKNIILGGAVLKECMNIFKGVEKKGIECYNKGTDSKKFKNYTYYKKIIKGS